MNNAEDTVRTAEASPFSVLVVGNTYLDEFVELPCFPCPDGKFTVQSIVDDIGGSATNAVCAFQKYGTYLLFS